MKKGGGKMNLGEEGEGFAVHYLKKQGYFVVERNFRCRFGEIDIIARKMGKLIFCEVKTRKNLNYGYPCQSVTKEKIRHISKTLYYYLMIKNLWHKDFQIDVIEIFLQGEKGYVNHIENISLE